MEGGKKVAAVIVVLIAVVIAGRFIMKGGDDKGGTTQKKTMVEMIDRETGEFISQAVEDWEKDTNSGNYKNPQTQKFTMIEPIECASCGEKIAPPDYPVISAEGGAPDSNLIAECKRLDAEYKCPKCGNTPFGGLVR